MLTIILLFLLIYVIYSNFNILKRYKHNKGYIDCYQEMLNNKEKGLEAINEYLNIEKDEEFITKAKLLKIYACLDRGEDYQEVIDNFDYRELYFKKGQIDNSKMNLNNDSFLWTILIISKAINVDKKEIIDVLVKKLDDIAELENKLEKKVVDNIYNLITTKDDYGFLKDLLTGEYSGLTYDKNMIGLYKRCSATFLTYVNELNGNNDLDYYHDDLNNFTNTMIGKALLENLGIYDDYQGTKETVISE